MVKLIKSTFYKEAETKRALAKFILNAKQLSFGPQCEKFEQRFAVYQGRKHCVMFNSGSAANFALIQALQNLGLIKEGDPVGFSALTWSTNVMPLIKLRLKPVPVDIELSTLNVSSRKLANTLNKTPLKILFITNVLGFCDDLDKIEKLCQERKILLIEDNCEALGSIYKKRKLGNFGLASTFSFYVGHHLSTIEGGAVCTNDADLATMLRLVRAHGWDRNLTEKEQGKIRRKHKINSPFHALYTFYDLGNNLRPTEIQGFLGNLQLNYIDEILNKRQTNFKKFANTIYEKSGNYHPIYHQHLDFVSNFAVPVICKTKELHSNLIKKCQGRIEIRPVISGDITRHPFFQKYVLQYANSVATPNAALIHDQGLYFGNNPELTSKEIDQILHVFA